MAIKVRPLRVSAVLAGSISISALYLAAGEVSGAGGPQAFVPNDYVCEGDSHTTGLNWVLGYPTHLARLTGLGITSVATAGL
jgi:hypothetical protein